MSSELSTRSPSASTSPSHDAQRDQQEVKPHADESHGKRQRRRESRWLDREWNRVYLLACVAGLMVDPLFLYAVSVSGPLMCVFLDGWFAATVTTLRCMVDAMHVWRVVTQLRTTCAAAAAEGLADEEEAAAAAAVGRAMPAYVRSKKGMLLDFFVILPVMQVRAVVIWVVAPAMMRVGSTTTVMTVLLIAFLFEYLPKIYHSVSFLRRMQNLSVYIFGTIWWGIALNLMAYFLAAHAVGACWYLLGVQRATKCLKEQCFRAARQGCASTTALTCADPLYYGATTARSIGRDRLAWAENEYARLTCLHSGENYQYGAYKWTVMLVANPSRLEKILLPIFWGLMTLR